MALSSENMVMPVAPSGGMGGFGGDWGWIILLLVLFGGGFGNGGGYGGGLYPWMNQADITTNGFQNQMLQSNISSIQNGITTGFAGVQNALCNGFGQAEIAANARQMADMNQTFAMQSALQNCCCENRAGLADVKYTIATEACADRSAVTNALREVIASNTANTQRILDQMCSDKIDAKNEKIADLERQLALASLAASQAAQTAQIEQYIASRPTTAA